MLRVFVALAYGHDDTEEWFENNLTPLLKDEECSVRRGDKIVSQRDLDDQVLHEIAQSDVVIADLTHASRAVYFEAGFAEGRKIPVVYTVRADHTPLSKSPETRIHFNLGMRNKVQWRRPADPEFTKGLRQRLTRLLQPILKRKAEEQELGDKRTRFASLTVEEQWDELTSALKQAIDESVPRRVTFYTYPESYPWSTERLKIGSLFDNGTVWAIEGLRRKQLTTQKAARELTNVMENIPADVQTPTSADAISLVRDLHVVVTRAKVQPGRLAAAYSDFNQVSSNPRWLRAQSTVRVPEGRRANYVQVLLQDGSFFKFASEHARAPLIGIADNGAITGMVGHRLVPRITDFVTISSPESAADLMTEVHRVIDEWADSRIEISASSLRDCAEHNDRPNSAPVTPTPRSLRS